jgi:hypothetical protein
MCSIDRPYALVLRAVFRRAMMTACTSAGPRFSTSMPRRFPPATRLVVTAIDQHWVNAAVIAATGYATSGIPSARVPNNSSCEVHPK